jgi:hypothetical protein
MSKGYLFESEGNEAIYIPEGISPRNPDGSFTQELKDYVEEQRQTGGELGAITATRIPESLDTASAARIAEERELAAPPPTEPVSASVAARNINRDSLAAVVEEIPQIGIPPVGGRKDIARTMARVTERSGEFLVDVKDLTKEVLNIALDDRSVQKIDGEWTNRDVFEPTTLEEKKIAGRIASQKTAELYARMFRVPVESLYDEETGEMRPSETLVGYGVDIAAFFTAYGILNRTKSIEAIKSPLLQEIVKASILDSVLFDATDGNSATAIESFFVDPVTGEEPSWAKEAIRFLSTDPDDSKAVARFKQVAVDSVILGSVFDTIGMAATRRTARERFNKSAEDLTDEERAEILVDGMQEAREQIAIRNTRDGEPLNISETDAGVRQIVNQAERNPMGHFRRLAAVLFTQRGVKTNLGQNLYDESIYSQRGARQEAGNVAARLERTINTLTSDSSVNQLLPEKIQEILTSDFDLPRSMNNEQYEETVKKLADQFSIPEEAATVALEARLLIDDMSQRMLHSEFIDQGLKEIINENVGAYLRRSYNAYETPGWTPGAEAKLNAENYLDDQIRNNQSEMFNIENKVYEQFGYDLSPDEVASKIDDIVKTRVSDTITDLLDTDVFQYTADNRAVNTGIFNAKKDLSPEIRALLGEIEDPAQNIIHTISKVSRFYETSRFHNNLDQVANGKYIFDEGVARDTDIFKTQIDMPNSPLHRKWTTKEMANSLQRDISFVPPGFFENPIVKMGATIKATSQFVKTVLNPETQAKNAWGGVQFAVSNGVWPFKDGLHTNATLWDNILKGGDENLEKTFVEYQRLGIVNTSVNLNEFKTLLGIGVDGTADNLINRLKEMPYGGQKASDVSDRLTDVYMATDDFFKINGFQRELATLKEAHPNESLEVLQQEAARKIKNTYPNYDRVPEGVKVIRMLPFGNFVGFPAEAWRTSYHIIKEGSREVTSGNPVLERRGRQRLAGYFGSTSFWKLAAPAAGVTYGFSDREEKALQTVTQTSWNEGSARNIIRIGDKFYAQDTTNFNAYNTVQSPFMALADDIMTGRLQGEELDTVLFEGGVSFFKNLTAPFVSEAMVTNSILDVRSALSNDGVTQDGTRIFRLGENPIPAMIEELFTPILPGAGDAARDVYNAAIGNRNEYSGKVPPWQAELAAALTGINLKEVDPAQALRFALQDYNDNKKGWPDARYPNFNESPDDVIKQLEDRQLLEIKALQNLYTMYDAVSVLYDQQGTYNGLYREDLKDRNASLTNYDLRNMTAANILEEAGADRHIIESMQNGSYYPSNTLSTSFNIITQSIDRGTPFATELFEEKKYNEYLNAINKYNYFPLNFKPTEKTWNGDPIPSGFGAREDLNRVNQLTKEQRKIEKEEETKVIIGNFAKGGEVYNVPQVPTEPDERIDKMTGLPYNEQAGGAFIDQEDRNLFNHGGEVGQKEPIVAMLKKTSSASQEQIYRDVANIQNMILNTQALRQREQDSKPLIKTPEEKRRGFAGGGKVIEIIANIAASIMKNSKKPITEAAATEAAENIVKQVNVQQTDEFSDVPVLMGIDDPDYAEFLETETRVLLREKHDLSPTELEEQFGLLSDPENFSKRRGYTEEEIQDWDRSVELQDQIEIETGFDTMDETSIIQNVLDDIQARDIKYNAGGKVLGSLGRTRRAEGGPPHRGYFKPVKELLTDNKDKEFVRRVLNPALNDALKRDKSVASNETHRMAAEVDDKTGNWFVYPTVVNKGGTLTKPANPMQAALDSGEYISFGKDKDQAVWLAADNYKIQEFKEHVKKAAP